MVYWNSFGMIQSYRIRKCPFRWNTCNEDFGIFSTGNFFTGYVPARWKLFPARTTSLRCRWTKIPTISRRRCKRNTLNHSRSTTICIASGLLPSPNVWSCKTEEWKENVAARRIRNSCTPCSNNHLYVICLCFLSVRVLTWNMISRSRLLTQHVINSISFL